MTTAHEARANIQHLVNEANAVVKDTRLTTAQKSSRLDRIEADLTAAKANIATAQAAARFMVGGDSAEESAREFGFGGRSARGLSAGLAAQGFRPMAAPQMDVSPDLAKELYDAAVSHKSLSVSTKATDSSSIAPSTISDYRLPPVTALREPTRVLSLLPAYATEHPTVTWYSTTGTTAAAAVAEGGTKPTSTIAYTANTGTVTKLAHVAELTEETFERLLLVLFRPAGRHERRSVQGRERRAAQRHRHRGQQVRRAAQHHRHLDVGADDGD